jgi:DNA-binding XRE family transcriptional regulator
MTKINKQDVMTNFNGCPKDLAISLNISLARAYYYIEKYSLHIVNMREKFLNAFNETRDIDLLESKLGISKNRIYCYLKEYGLKLPKREREFQCRVSKKDLEHLYKNHTTDEIAKIYDVSRQAVCNWLKGYGIEKRKKGRYPLLDRSLSKDDLVKLYKELGSLRLVADKVKLKTCHVSRLFREYKIDLDYGPKPKISEDCFKRDFTKYSFDDLAKRYGVHRITIFRMAKKLGLSKRTTFNITKEYCEKNKHRPSKEIAGELGCSIALVNTKMREFGVMRK